MVSEWRRIQQQEYQQGQQKYRKTGSYFGYFSVPEFYVTSQIADRLAQVEGPVLDIGCGLLPMPEYLKYCKQPFGIDPYLGKVRQFPMAQAIGEHLPFRNNYFSAVLLMSVIDHLINPKLVVREISRVLIDKGLVFIWYISKSRVDKHHLWAFDKDKLLWLFAAGFQQVDFIRYPADRGVGFPRTEMMVLEKL